MATKIDFTDAIGAATLTNGKTFPGDRFANWNPNEEPFGDAAARQSDGATTMFAFRTDYSVSFELRGIPSRTTAGSALVDIANRLRRHLLGGGTCSVTTGDAVASVYATCGLMPGTRPEVRLSDVQELEYTFSATLLNLAGSPVPFYCRYADQ